MKEKEELTHQELSGIDWELGADADCCLWDGLAMGPYYIALGTQVTYDGTCNVRKRNVYMYM